jgi:ABC-type amino acid transport substrate-binding protein
MLGLGETRPTVLPSAGVLPDVPFESLSDPKQGIVMSLSPPPARRSLIAGFDQLKGKRVAVVQGTVQGTVQDDYATMELLGRQTGLKPGSGSVAFPPLKAGTAS